MKKKKIIKQIILLLTILLLCTPVFESSAIHHFLLDKSFSSFCTKDDPQWVSYYLIGVARTPAFKRGANVLIIFENYENSSVELPNDAPWWAETNTSSGWTTVYIPHHGDTKIVLYPREYRGIKKTRVIWTWNLTFSNGSLLPEGYYRIVLPTNRCIYYQEFIISDTYGKLDWCLIDDILNSSVSMNKTYDVVLYLRAKNVTSELIDYLRREIGNFTVRAVMNSSEIASDFNYSLLYTILQKYQILKAIHLSVVDLIILNQQDYDLCPRNNTNIIVVRIVKVKIIAFSGTLFTWD